MANKKQKLIRLADVIQELKLPGKTRPLSPQAIRQSYLPALGIKPVNSEGLPKTRPNEEAWITADQAEEIRKAFKLLNWRKFKDID